MSLPARLPAAGAGAMSPLLFGRHLGRARKAARLDLPEQEIRVSNKNSADFECFRFDDLTFFYGMSERERLQRRI